jgi:F-type H+-transporting ATPase subunit gamma
MANLKDIKRRIGSVKSTQKITNAMKLVSASKFARATHAVQASRPYGRSFDQMVTKILHLVEDSSLIPLLKVRDVSSVLVVVVGSDRGLCGGFNTNILKAAEQTIVKQQAHGAVTLLGWGRRPLLFANRRMEANLEGREKVLAQPTYELASELAEELMEHFTAKRFDSIHIVYPRFKSAVEQEPTTVQLLPVIPASEGDHEQGLDVILEPGLKPMVEPLVRRWVISTVHRILLESAASEHGARMSAMDNATSNAKEVQKKLTLVYNRARQAAITTELTEIISGAEALN